MPKPQKVFASFIRREDESGAFIRVHQVVHDAIKTVMKDHQGPRKSSQIINAVAASFSQFITDIPEDNKMYSDTVHLVPHLKALIMVFEPLFPEETPTHVKYETESQKTFIRVIAFNLARFALSIVSFM